MSLVRLRRSLKKATYSGLKISCGRWCQWTWNFVSFICLPCVAMAYITPWMNNQGIRDEILKITFREVAAEVTGYNRNAFINVGFVLAQERPVDGRSREERAEGALSNNYLHLHYKKNISVFTCFCCVLNWVSGFLLIFRFVVSRTADDIKLHRLRFNRTKRFVRRPWPDKTDCSNFTIRYSNKDTLVIISDKYLKASISYVKVPLKYNVGASLHR